MRNAYPFSRHWGCRVTDAASYCGLTAVILENQTLRVCILPEKGAEIIGFEHKPTDTDPLFRRGPLRNSLPFPATIPDPAGSFVDNYSGGWQEIFPSGGGPSQVKGASLGTHGEVFQLPWRWEILEDQPGRVSVRFWVDTLRTPFHLERIMCLEGDQPILTLQETLTNQGGEEMPFMWGHHPAFGAPFLDDSCVLDAPAAHIEVHGGDENISNRLIAGSQGTWPWMSGKNGAKIDLRQILSQREHMYAMFYLTSLNAGWCALTNLNRGLGVALTWDLNPFRVLWVWQEFGGSTGYPWYSQAYALGLEPFTSYTTTPGSGLAEVMRTGQEMTLSPGQSLHANLKALFYLAPHAPGVGEVSPDGKVILRK